MNLIVEQGNTLLKMAVFDDNGLVECLTEKDNGLLCIRELIARYHPDKGIMSSVTGEHKQLTDQLKATLTFFLWFDETTPVPVRIEYETINTLGKDRIAAVVGAYHLQSGRNVLVIDAGTALTFELLDASGSYKGGNISPGMFIRFHSLYRFTKQLPLVAAHEEVPFIGTSTETAIRAGVINGIVYEIDGYIDAMKSMYGDILVYLTGGNAFYFEKRIKNHIFAEPNLVLIGLNSILEYNAKT